MEKEGSFVWLNCEWLPAHHYQRKSIPEKQKQKHQQKKKKKEEKSGKPKKSKDIIYIHT